MLALSAFGADIILEHADEIITDVSGGGMRTRLYGSIRIIHEERFITAGYANWDKAIGRLKVTNDVTLSDSIQIIKTDTLLYFRDTKMAFGNGNVRYVRRDSTVFVSGDYGEYDGIAEVLDMTGSPHLTSIDTVDSAVVDIDATSMKYYLQLKMGIAVESVYVKIESKDSLSDPISIRCDSMVFYPSRDEVYAFGNVEIVQFETHVSCSKASYYRVAGRMILDGAPVVEQGTNRLEGDKMTIELKEGEIERILVNGSTERGIDPVGFWRPPEDSLKEVPESRFSAEKMVFDFANGKINIAHLIRQAHVDYFPMPEDPLTRESNTTIGDSIAVWFGEAKFDSIEVHNGVDGYYVSRELSSDSLKSVESEDTLYYSGDYLALSRENEIVAVQGEAKISYDDMTLEAGDVQYEIKRNLLIARPQVLEDSTVGMPVLSDNKQTIRGKKIIYNVDTGRGRMVSASSSLDLGYFRGGVVHKAQGETLFVANSEFVPCECETAMTHFWSDRVKLIPKEKAIARHIVLYIGHLPLFAIPFFVFPVQSGRTSGLLTFDIGQFQKGDRFIRNIGYYWAPSDYWDIKASVDYDEGKGLILRSAGQYVLRYKMKGNISTIYEIRRQREFLQSTGSNRWSISGSHLQYLWPRSSITARASFVSDKEYLTDVEFDPQERMQRNLSSSAAFSQDFDWGYLSLGVERNENLETGKITSKIPKIKISRYTRPLFPAENELNSKFYNKLSLALNGYSIYYKESDTLGSLEHFGVQSDPSLSLPFLLGPYLTLNPRVSGRFVTIDEGVDSTAWPMRFTYNAGVDANTNIYGRIPLVGFLGIESLKHDIAPKFGLSWTPEFESGENFYSFAGISAGGGSEAFKANVSITQDLGLLKLADSLGNQRNIRLGTVTTSTSYDFFSEGAKISDIRTSIRTSPASWLSMTAGFTHSVYPEGSDEPSTYRLLSREITTNLSYRGNFSFGDSLSRVRRDFKASISHYISDRLSGGVLSVSHWLKGGLDIYITQNWRLEYSHYYDIEKMEKVSDELRLWRDMGCWEGTFVWVPSGFRKGWYFRINIKKLPDIKVEGSRGKVR